MRVHILILILAAAGAIALASCDSAVLSRAYVATDSTGGAVAEFRQAAAERARSVSAASPAASRDAVSLGTRDVTPSMVIRTGQASVEVDSLEPAVALIRALAGRVGGYVANTAMQTGRGQLRAATLELKIPADRFDEALAGLPPIGKLESVDVNAQDVGEEFVDVTARMTNSRRLEARLIDLLAARTGKLKDVLDVEQARARARRDRAVRGTAALLEGACHAQHADHLGARAGSGRRARRLERDGRGLQAGVAQLRRPARGVHPVARRADPARRGGDRRLVRAAAAAPRYGAVATVFTSIG